MHDPVRARAVLWVNGLTLSRIPVILLFMLAALRRGHGGGVGWAGAALLLLCLGALTDLVDGWLARRWNAQSRFGGHADPLADKMYYLVSMPTLVYLLLQAGDRVNALSMLLLTVVYLMRDQWVSFLRAIGAASGIPGNASWAGKLRTLMSFPYLCLLYAHLGFTSWRLPLPVRLAAESVLVLLTLLSLAVYTRAYLPALRQAMREE